MFHPLSLFIGSRYVRTRRRGFFVSFISWVSMLGVCLGVAALIVVLSVMNGFEGELRSRLLDVSAHATLTGAAPQFADWPKLSERARQVAGVAAVAPFIEMQGMIGRAGVLTGVKLRGILPEREAQVADVAAHMLDGDAASLAAGAQHVLIGSALAWQLQAQLGDELTMLIPEISGTELRPRLQNFVITGIFEFGAQEQDSALALIHLQDAAALAGTHGLPTGLRLKFDDLFAAPAGVQRVKALLGGGLVSSDWTVENASYFRAVRIEKTMMAVMLMLIVAIAAFNIIAALVMVVNEKRTDIAILRTVGLSPRQVIAVFMTQGLLIGWAGIAAGVLLGLALALNVGSIVPWLEQALGIHFFDPSVYYITQIPAEVHADQVLWIAAIAFLLTMLATIYPAQNAAQVQPAEALRYE